MTSKNWVEIMSNEIGGLCRQLNEMEDLQWEILDVMKINENLLLVHREKRETP